VTTIFLYGTPSFVSAITQTPASGLPVAALVTVPPMLALSTCRPACAATCGLPTT
jgi:hypothetical protein